MLKYAYYYVVFHAAKGIQSLKPLPFKMWIAVMQIKLNAAKQLIKAKETDWANEVAKL